MSAPGMCDILIIDDNQAIGQLIQEVLSTLGYSCRCLWEGGRTIEVVRELRPRLILLDIMMPGADGLLLCRHLKNDPEHRETKIVMCSSKPPVFEKPRAFKAGADGFVPKPFELGELRDLVHQLLGAPAKAPVKADRPATLRVTYWGTRGHAPNMPSNSIYGKHTPCVSVQAASGECWIFDAGTGLAGCAQHLLSTRCPSEITLLLTHFHPGHVEGLSRLALAGQPGLSLKIAAPQDVEVNLQELLQRALAGHAPLRAKVQPLFLYEQNYKLGPKARLEVLYALHPTTTLAFCLEFEGKKIVYCADTELDEGVEVPFGNFQEKLSRFATDADLLIHDAHFTPDDYAQSPGGGHCAWPSALNLAAKAGVRKLALFHLRADYSDERLAGIESELRARIELESLPLTAAIAKEGETVDFA